MKSLSPISIAGLALLVFSLGGWGSVSHADILPHGPEFFQHGVASGDPLPDRVILWTRITPTLDDLPGRVDPGAPDVSVGYDIATDDQFDSIVVTGSFTAQPESDYTVKIDPAGLAPGTSYYYRFTYSGTQSVTGRVKTAPADTTMVGVRFGLVSCANYEGGIFSAYRYLALRDDLDFILHGGDYIYEYPHNEYPAPAESGRVHDPEVEIINLEHYRRRHAKYKADLDLQQLHQKYPFICTWDDHESTNDSHREGAENHTEGAEGTWVQRQARAYQAYAEWMPIRLPDPTTAPTRIYRSSRYGALIELITTDLRQYRDAPPNQAELIAGMTDKTQLGPDQKTWFLDTLSNSQATWKLLNNSVMITAVDVPAVGVPELEAIIDFASKGQSPTGALVIGQPYNTDQWDGYPDERAEIIDHIDDNDINNVVYLTGDIHSMWATEVPKNKTNYKLPYNATLNPDGGRAVAVEIVCPSITSDNLNEITGLPPRNPTSIAAEEGFKVQNPWIKDVELDSHGFTVVDVTAARIQADWFFISDRAARSPSLRFHKGYEAASWDLSNPDGGPAAVLTETENRLPPR